MNITTFPHTQVDRAQLQSFSPTPVDDPPGYSYLDRLESTSGNTLPDIREAGFDQLNSLAKKKAYAGVGGAMTKGVAFGLGIAAAVRLLAGSSPGTGLVLGCVAGASFLGSRALNGWEERLGQETEQQVHFLQDLDQAQLKLTGVPSDPWIFI